MDKVLFSASSARTLAEALASTEEVAVTDSALGEVMAEVIGCWRSEIKSRIAGNGTWGYDPRVIKALLPGLRRLAESDPKDEDGACRLALRMLARSSGACPEATCRRFGY